MKTSHIYLNVKPYDGSVFVTQIADWLKLYWENGIKFNYIHLFPIQKVFNKTWIGQQTGSIKKVIPLWVAKSWFFPSRSILVYFNSFLWSRKIKKIAKDSDKIIIFSRIICGKEMSILRKILKTPVYFIYDARAASMEENKFKAVTENRLCKAQFNMFSHISYTEYMTVKEADRVFAVSNKLKTYFIQNYGSRDDKFFIYPCLSDNRKFYYDKILRKDMRVKLGYSESDMVLLYAGGLKNGYHMLDKTLGFLNETAKKLSNVKILLLSKDNFENENFLIKYPYLKDRYISMSIPNEEMVKYLNAADFGLLFRENVPMNNVASPSKYAEYMLCGLPTIISPGIGDYSELCVREGLGIMLDIEEISTPEVIDFKGLFSTEFSREKIARFGQTHFSKQSRISEIIKEFTIG